MPNKILAILFLKTLLISQYQIIDFMEIYRHAIFARSEERRRDNAMTGGRNRLWTYTTPRVRDCASLASERKDRPNNQLPDFPGESIRIDRRNDIVSHRHVIPTLSESR